MMSESPAPETLEGWYVLHDAYHLEWSALNVLDSAQQRDIISDLQAYLMDCGRADGDTGFYQIVGQKADFLLVHYRRTPKDLESASRRLRRSALAPYLRPSGSYLSVIEASLYEATSRARGLLARQGLESGSAAYDAAYAQEIEVQRGLLHERVFRSIPDGRHLCFYPMNKRRGEMDNWYTLSIDERRDLMRGHGALGRKYHQTVTQVVSGSIGFDDWEWSVDLHADDPLVFKKLIYDMRFDPVSAKYAEFGQFMLGVRLQREDLNELFTA